MKRRSFIKLSATTSVLSLLPTEVFALFQSAGMSTCPDISGKKIVLIQLSGANDGINTVVPLNQYDTYAALRPTIKLDNTGANSVINLDTTLALENQVGLHPALVGFKSLYDSGFMRLIQGVGYPNQDKSHFKSTDLWLTGGDGTPANNAFQSGWMGRFLEHYYADFLSANFPLGIQLGSSENSLGFHGETEHGMSLNINGQDPSGFYSIVNGLGGPAPSVIPDSEYGDLIQYILNNDTSTNTYAQTISTAFNSGTNTVTYANNGLSNQLKTVAKFISGGLQTKVYLVKIGGFDTHNQQVADTATPHLGKHADLLSELSGAISSFINDMNNQGLNNDILAVTFSEFGRKAGENGGLGTDHGEIAPMFVFGSAVSPGVSGTNINLSEATSENNYQVQTIQHDYRRVFSTILQDWLGAGNSVLDLTFYDYTQATGFSGNKIDALINAQNLIPISCYSDAVLTANEFNTNNDIIVYSNPKSETISVHSMDAIFSITVYTIDGKFVKKFTNPLTTNDYTIAVNQLSIGLYNLIVSTSQGNYPKKIFIRR
ncbi:DUF1501 domain-containing protein [Flavobacterium sp. CYK-4]|uniref:DUF1501 domain-containing protein n=1 Tax=Flavobacterium lotistagni TaxID=2709660 RepID=UPI00140A26AA|nr:DUF1501 domain-containing protein [Flavobacterium lotistagni]NHM08146.1 DUF1501 domain-containing protein [Flavobacterium lotistagni]